MKRFLLVLPVAALCWGCAVGPVLHATSFSSADKLVKEKKYQEALAFYDRTARESAGTDRGASALFAAAELRVWHDNPGRDYVASLQKFDEFVKQYPRHEKAREAQSWRHIIRTVLELRKENEQLMKNIEELKRVDIRHEQRRTGK